MVDLLLGERLKKLREEKEITQKYLARHLGVSDRSVGYYETNQRTPPPDILEKIADFFDVSIDYLLGRTDIRKPSSPNVTTENTELDKLIKITSNLSPESIKDLEKYAELLKIKESIKEGKDQMSSTSEKSV